MSERVVPGACPEIEDLADIADSPRDPRRPHLDDCPRCRALLAAYREFLDVAPENAAAREREAETALAAYLERIGRPHRESRIPGRWRGFAAALRRPPVWAAAALLAVVVGGAALLLVPRGPQPVLLRGPTGAEREAVLLERPHLLAGGGLELRWRPVAGADSYRVLLYSAETLEEIARLGPGREPRAVLPPEKSRAWSRRVLWRVEALRNGDLLAASAAHPLDLPLGF